ncbi:MAG: hypothetical protein NTY51_15845 [Deltaproteobacteria bacterium]|nr:hypothetical protein [Deltaproteobacteria bacterium]
MRIFSALLAIFLFLCLFQPSSVLADSTDKHINNLKSDDPEIRAKAAFDLGCS